MSTASATISMAKLDTCQVQLDFTRLFQRQQDAFRGVLPSSMRNFCHRCDDVVKPRVVGDVTDRHDRPHAGREVVSAVRHPTNGT